MSDEIKELAKRLRATFFEVRDFSLHDVRDAANALERVTEERDRLKAEVERLRGEQRLKSLIGPSENAVERIIAERDRLKAALVRLRDCDWVISLPDRMDAVREIAREALEAKE